MRGEVFLGGKLLVQRVTIHAVFAWPGRSARRAWEYSTQLLPGRRGIDRAIAL